MSGRKKKVEWVVAGGAPGEQAHCTRCGKGLVLGMPQPIDIFVAAANAFVKLHANCQPGEYKEPEVTRPEQWLMGRDTGTSSMTIYHVMQNLKDRKERHFDVPHDPADFGRCYRLLKLFPQWRERLPEVAAAFPEWHPFVREWDRMTELYERDLASGTSHELYALMQVLRKEKRA